MARLRFTILGCGASPGVPRITGDWGECDPGEPRNSRTRSSALVERIGDEGTTRVLIDSGPDVRMQLIAAKVTELHGVVYTHSHADHVHGIDDLRTFWMTMRKPLTIYSDDETQVRLDQGFGYCFWSPPDSPYPPFLVRKSITAGAAFTVAGPGGPLAILPLEQIHGTIRSLGFRVGPLAYSCDFNDLPPETSEALGGLELWVLGALRRRPHPSHSSLSEAIEWIARISPKQAVLTHMTNELDYRALRRELPPNIVPAYDGQSFEFELPADQTAALVP